ncbi:S35F6-like protein [Mya arenaria]|uniref:S35F6-like protein n=1 Tax=Mya arenaria TaxID=6604 RepID=A0ABY7FIK3_MYAAR|nr:S35F6-like protein [Mya arenaria]
MAALSCLQILLMIGMLVTGSINTLSKKAQNDCKILQPIILVPTLCDLVGTSLAGIGLLYVDASVWQMLRGSIIIFAGILSKIFLKRKLKWSHWLGMMLVMVGLVLVGCSSVFKNQNHKTNGGKALIGILLILGSQIVSASQMVIEETFLKGRCLHPLHVVGLEGSFGVVLMSLVVLPAMYFIPGSDVQDKYENSVDALYQISNSPRLLLFCLFYLSSIAFYNYFGLAVTRSLTAVHRTLIDACRTIMVWGLDMLIYYALDKNFGEPFDKTYGLLQIDGFLFLLIGTGLYNQLLDLRNFVPCCVFPSEELQNVSHDPGRHSNIQDVSFSEEEVSDDENTRLLKGKR